MTTNTSTDTHVARISFYTREGHLIEDRIYRSEYEAQRAFHRLSSQTLTARWYAAVLQECSSICKNVNTIYNGFAS